MPGPIIADTREYTSDPQADRARRDDEQLREMNAIAERAAQRLFQGSQLPNDPNVIDEVRRSQGNRNDGQHIDPLDPLAQPAHSSPREHNLDNRNPNNIPGRDGLSFNYEYNPSIYVLTPQQQNALNREILQYAREQNQLIDQAIKREEQAKVLTPELKPFEARVMAIKEATLNGQAPITTPGKVLEFQGKLNEVEKIYTELSKLNVDPDVLREVLYLLNRLKYLSEVDSQLHESKKIGVREASEFEPREERMQFLAPTQAYQVPSGVILKKSDRVAA